ncbi:MAG: hypothetical protein IJ719_03200 [Clostridia bacterium]|nr:hypothetical protein [Clostridia bacterium]
MKKKKKKSTVHFEVIAGVSDVFRSALAVLLIFVLMLMLNSLLSWLRGDLMVTFSELTHNIGDAIWISQ